MCGLFGAAKGLYDREKKIVQDLGIMSQLRGLHSTGIAVVRENLTGPKRGKFTTHLRKRATDATAFFGIPKVKETLNQQAVKTIIGHCRHATVGEINVNNAHPFLFNTVVGVHNGTIEALANGRHDTDSANLYQMLAESNRDIKDISNMHHKYWNKGAYALVWYDTEQRKLHIMRNSRRSLFCVESTGTYFWASELAMLVCGVARHHSSSTTEQIFNDTKFFSTDMLYTLDLRTPAATLQKKPLLDSAPVQGKGFSFVPRGANDDVEEIDVDDKQEVTVVDLFKDTPKEEPKKQEDTSYLDIFPFVQSRHDAPQTNDINSISHHLSCIFADGTIMPYTDYKSYVRPYFDCVVCDDGIEEEDAHTLGSPWCGLVHKECIRKEIPINGKPEPLLYYYVPDWVFDIKGVVEYPNLADVLEFLTKDESKQAVH